MDQTSLGRDPSAYSGNYLVDVGLGEQKNKFWQLSGDFPLNHSKQKCKMLPNNHHDYWKEEGGVTIPFSGWIQTKFGGNTP